MEWKTSWPEHERLLTLSTAHMPSTEPGFGGLRFVEHEYGYIVFVNPEEQRVPEWLTSIIDAGVKSSCTLINFDQDADSIDCFKIYNW
tara:strand:- start:47 stop:310 length:264 start_codon:yes stop_codon:yes gene_type:complete